MTQPAEPLKAAAFALTATAFFAATTLLAKALGTDALGDPLHPLQVSHARFLFAFLGVALATIVMRAPIKRPHLKLHIGRTSLGWIGVSLMFAAAARIPLGDATAISFLNPVFAMILAIPLLGEQVGRWRWTAAILALVGALVLLRPGPGSFQPAAFLAFGAALAIGVEITFIKKLSGREPGMQILFFNNGLGMLIASLAVVFVWQPPSAAQWPALIAIGVLMASGQALNIQAMKRADASFVGPFSYATLVFAALYDAAIFGVLPDAVSYGGAALILLGAAVMAWRERRRAQVN